MATLSADSPRVFETGHDDGINEIPMIATDIIYDGAAVGDNASGLARPLVAADPFLGFATEKADNSAGSASDIKVKIKSKGVAKLTVTGVSSTADVGEKVYATDDDTFTLTASGASAIGRVLRWITSTTCLVSFQGSTEIDHT